MLSFLFTDLEGSTRLWEEHPTEMGAALALHDDIIRKSVVDRRGEVVKTTGDGWMAAFEEVSDCIHACVDAQLILASNHLADAPGPSRCEWESTWGRRSLGRVTTTARRSTERPGSWPRTTEVRF